jgi:hypothetical protein
MVDASHMYVCITPNKVADEHCRSMPPDSVSKLLPIKGNLALHVAGLRSCFEYIQTSATATAVQQQQTPQAALAGRSL